MSLQGIKLVTFDATNTLLKFRNPPWQHYTDVAREYGFRGTGDDVKQRLLNSFKLAWTKYPNFGRDTISWEEWWRNVVRQTFDGQLPPNTDVNSIANRLIEEFKTSKCWCPVEGGDKLIRTLRNSGIHVGVISNFDPRLNDILHDFQIHNSFDFVLTSYEIGYSKPDKRIFKHALKIVNKLVQPSESLHIGDDVKKDYEGARGAGWHALLVTQKLDTETPPAPGHVFINLEELSLAIEHRKLRL